MELGISEAGRRLIDAVIDAPVAWRSPGELAERLGWDLDRTLDQIADLDAAGWLEAWELVDGPVVTLSPAATAGCGVRLVEVGRDETPRWARRGEPDPPAASAPGSFRTQAWATLDLVADDRPTVEQQAIQAEEADPPAPAADGDAATAARLARLPRPTLLIGGGLTPWPGPGAGRDADCPACRSAHLPAQAYCLRCDRWGLDAELAALDSGWGRPRRQPPRPPGRQAEARRQEDERRKRRQKRKERRHAQARQLRLGPRCEELARPAPAAG